MRGTKATELLSALVQGLDPDTGAELPTGGVLHRADVLRALLCAIAALREQSAREARRAARPARVGMPWTAEEERKLVQLFQAGEALADITSQLERTFDAVESRLERLGLITPDQRKTRRMY